MSFLSVYRTVTFWLCCAIVFVNYGVFRFAQHAHRPDLADLAIACMLCGFVGAISHWYLERVFSKK